MGREAVGWVGRQGEGGRRIGRTDDGKVRSRRGAGVRMKVGTEGCCGKVGGEVVGVVSGAGEEGLDRRLG